VRHYFFDSSTFLKLFVVEEGYSRVREIVRGARADSTRTRVSVCDLAHPECVSAMRQMLERGAGGRRGIRSASLRRTLPEVHAIFRERSHLLVIEASTVIPESADVAMRHRVKGADAVHIAAAQQVQRRVGDGEEFWFVSADMRQAAAARHEGMPVLDPTV
jgi:predicted nucleic acid-binding protein